MLEYKKTQEKLRMKKVWNTPKLALLKVSKTQQGGNPNSRETNTPGNPAHHNCSNDRHTRCAIYS